MPASKLPKIPTSETWLAAQLGKKKHHFGGDSKTGTVTWFTPKWLIDLLGPFSLDPCTAEKRPFPTAARHYTKKDDGLTQSWQGIVWCNPPYDKPLPWLLACARHKAAIALVFNRTETNWFMEGIWEKAYAVNFVKGRIPFLKKNGRPGKGGSGSGSVLVAFDKKTALRIQKVPGIYIEREQWLDFNPF